MPDIISEMINPLSEYISLYSESGILTSSHSQLNEIELSDFTYIFIGIIIFSIVIYFILKD